MKKISLCIVCLACILSVSATAAKKEKDSGLKVVYVSVNEAVEKTGEQQKISAALNKERNHIQSLIRKKSDQFKASALKIKKEMALLSEEEKVKKYESIQKMQIAMERFVKEKEMEFQKKENSLRAGVINKIKVVVDSVAKKAKVDVVRNKDGVLWVRPQWDLTDKVVRIYRKKYKK